MLETICKTTRCHIPIYMYIYIYSLVTVNIKGIGEWGDKKRKYEKRRCWAPMEQQKQKQNTECFFHDLLDHGGFIAKEACILDGMNFHCIDSLKCFDLKCLFLLAGWKN